MLIANRPAPCRLRLTQSSARHFYLRQRLREPHHAVALEHTLLEQRLTISSMKNGLLSVRSIISRLSAETGGRVCGTLTLSSDRLESPSYRG